MKSLSGYDEATAQEFAKRTNEGIYETLYNADGEKAAFVVYLYPD